jgi:hypothetical protein
MDRARESPEDCGVFGRFSRGDRGIPPTTETWLVTAAKHLAKYFGNERVLTAFTEIEQTSWQVRFRKSLRFRKQ